MHRQKLAYQHQEELLHSTILTQEAERKRFAIRFDLMENEMEIKDKIIELNLFRVLQELINNSIMHGKASEIVIKIWLKANLNKLEYLDNGIGFDSLSFQNKKGLGMNNMESRLHMIHATYQYDSFPGKGFKMVIEIGGNT